MTGFDKVDKLSFVMYIVFAIAYALIISIYNIFKKCAVKKTNEIAVLVMFVTVSFLCSLMWIPKLTGITTELLLIFMLKGIICPINWFLVLKVLKSANLSCVSLTTVISTVFVFIIGLTVFGESASFLQYFGATVILFSAIAINFINKKNNEPLSLRQFIYLFISALISTACSVIDKYTTQHLSNFEVQFWFLLFACLFTWGLTIADSIIHKHWPIKKQDFKNFWIYLAGIALFVADVFLFLAYVEPGSRLIMINILTKLKTIFAVIFGVIIFKEKNKWLKILIAAFALAGVILISL